MKFPNWSLLFSRLLNKASKSLFCRFISSTLSQKRFASSRTAFTRSKSLVFQSIFLPVCISHSISCKAVTMLFFWVVFNDFAMALKEARLNSLALLNKAETPSSFHENFSEPLCLAIIFPPRIKAATVVITVPKPKPVGGCSRSFSNVAPSTNVFLILNKICSAGLSDSPVKLPCASKNWKSAPCPVKNVCRRWLLPSLMMRSAMASDNWADKRWL